MIDRDFWFSRRVFVTGHTGFKGGWLSTWLAHMGAEISGYALAPDTAPSYFELCNLNERINSRFGDVREQAELRRALTDAQPEVVFHLAAQPLVRRSYREPIATFATNVLGTANLLEAVRQTRSVRVVVVITSDKCYENNEWTWGYREADGLGGHDPYSASKACAEVVCGAFRRSFFHSEAHPVALATVRAGNVFGGGDWSEDRLVPDAIKALQRGAPLMVRNPQAVRPWQHVLQPLSGYLLLAQRLYCDGGRYAEAWNFGPHDEDAVTVADLAEMITGHWGPQAKWRAECSAGQQHEDNFLRLDCSKARSRLGWRPCLPLEKGVEMTVRWYREALSAVKPSMYETSCAQIRWYEQHIQKVAHEVR